MKLCAGAASRRVTEEAAKLRVPQIVASRRQVGETVPGYTGYTSASLVQAVKELSGGATQVVRDHGGPYQNGDRHDDWTAALDADLDAGFGALHLDVSALPRDDQPGELARLCKRYRGLTAIEVGGERDDQLWLNCLLETALRSCHPQAAIAALGGHIHADRQCGRLISVTSSQAVVSAYADRKVAVKAHNMDWLGGRQDYGIDGYYNVAPEFANLEIDAWLHLLPHAEGQALLDAAYESDAWLRWFGLGEGTRFERSRAALRYRLEMPDVARVLDCYDDSYVRGVIRDAILHG